MIFYLSYRIVLVSTKGCFDLVFTTFWSGIIERIISSFYNNFSREKTDWGCDSNRQAKNMGNKNKPKNISVNSKSNHTDVPVAVIVV